MRRVILAKIAYAHRVNHLSGKEEIMLKRLWPVLVLSLVLMAAFVVSAQDISPQAVPADDADVAVRFPPPVWVLSGDVDSRYCRCSRYEQLYR